MGNSVAPASLQDSDPSLATTQTNASLITITSSDAEAENDIGNAVVANVAAGRLSHSQPQARPDKMKPQQQLYYAAAHGECDMIRASIESGASVNAPDRSHEEQEEEGSLKKKVKLSKAEQDEADETEKLKKIHPVTNDFPLHKAVEQGHLEAVQLLLEKGANLESQNKLGSTPLHRAVSCQHVEVVKYLLLNGAKVHCVNAAGNTPLHIASYEGNLEIAIVLLTHEADSWKSVIVPNACGLSPIDYARKKPMHEMLSSYRITPSRTTSLLTRQGTHTLNSPDAQPHRLNTRTSFSHPVNDDFAGSRRDSHDFPAGTPKGSHNAAAEHHHHQPNVPIVAATHENDHSLATENLLEETDQANLYSSSMTQPLPPALVISNSASAPDIIATNPTQLNQLSPRTLSKHTSSSSLSPHLKSNLSMESSGRMTPTGRTPLPPVIPPLSRAGSNKTLAQESQLPALNRPGSNKTPTQESQLPPFSRAGSTSHSATASTSAP